MTFWIGLVLVLLPTGKTHEKTASPQVGATEAITAATAAVSDLGGFCVRQPAACDIGGQAATVIGHRAQAGARTVYEFINEKADKSDKAEADKVDTAPDKPEIRPQKVETKAAAKPEPKPEKKAENRAEKKPVKAQKKNPDHTGSIAKKRPIDADGAPAFDNAVAPGAMPQWSISDVESVSPLFP